MHVQYVFFAQICCCQLETIPTYSWPYHHKCHYTIILSLNKKICSKILREITNFLTGSSRTEHEAAAAVGGKDLYGAGQVVNDNELFADDQVNKV